MPTYFNPNQDAVHSRGVTIAPRTTLATIATLDLNTASITGREKEGFEIYTNRNDKLYLRFNDDYDWITITLTPSTGSPVPSPPGRTAAEIADDINNNSVMYSLGYSPASDNSGYLKLEAPIYKPWPDGSPAPSPWAEPARTSRIYIRPSPAAVMLGLPVSVQSPIKESFPTLVKLDDSPMYNPIVSTSGTLAAPTSYTPPNPDVAAMIRIFVPAGTATFRINDPAGALITWADLMEPLFLPSGGKVEEIFVVSGSIVVEEWLYIQASINK